MRPLGEDAKLPNSFDIKVTVGLIEYPSAGSGQVKYMLVDTCQAVNWPIIKKKIEEIVGSIYNVTHVLATHWHQDHMQNLKEFKGAYSFTAGKTSIIGTKFYGSQQMYLEGYIEVPEVRYEVVNDAHSHDDTVFIVDSENQGLVAFVGDIIYGDLKNYPIDLVIKLEKRATIDPVKKYLWLKNFVKNNEGVTIYPGHDEPMGYQEVCDYLNTLNKSQEFQKFLLNWIKEQEKKLLDYQGQL